MRGLSGWAGEDREESSVPKDEGRAVVRDFRRCKGVEVTT